MRFMYSEGRYVGVETRATQVTRTKHDEVRMWKKRIGRQREHPIDVLPLQRPVVLHGDAGAGLIPEQGMGHVGALGAGHVLERCPLRHTGRAAKVEADRAMGKVGRRVESISDSRAGRMDKPFGFQDLSHDNP